MVLRLPRVGLMSLLRRFPLAVAFIAVIFLPTFALWISTIRP